MCFNQDSITSLGWKKVMMEKRDTNKQKEESNDKENRSYIKNIFDQFWFLSPSPKQEIRFVGSTTLETV